MTFWRAASLAALTLLLGPWPAPLPAFATQAECDGTRACYRLVPEESVAWFEAHSSMGTFRGESRELRGWGEAAAVDGFADARGRVEVPVASIGTGIGLRNRHMRSELRADDHPIVAFELSSVDPDETAPETGRVLVGRLTIRGSTRDVRIPAVVVMEAGEVRVTGEYPTRFTDWGMDPPTRMLGLARVSDILVIGFDLVFRERADADQAGDRGRGAAPAGS